MTISKIKTKDSANKKQAKVEKPEPVEVIVNDLEREIIVKDPTVEQDKKAREIYLNTYNELRLDKSNGFVPKAKIKDLMKDLGVWSDELDTKLTETANKINELLKPLNEGGISLKDMRERALEVQLLRRRMSVFFSLISEYESNFTYESKSDEAKFEYLLYSCCYYADSDEKVFKTVEEYNNCRDHELIEKATSALTAHLYGDFKELYKELPESKFLIDYGFLDEDLKPTEKSPTMEKTEFKPFLDEDGNPVDPK